MSHAPVFLLSLLLIGPALAEPWKPILEDFQPEILRESWTDAARERDVPMKIFLPATTEPAPVVIWSHGLGGSREGADYLGNHLSSHGYVAVHVQHPGSDSSVWQGASTAADLQRILQATASVANFTFRAEDIPFVLDELERQNQKDGGPLQGRLDLEHVGMSGHSFGAGTSQTMIGQQWETQQGIVSLVEDRVDAAVLMSPSPARKRNRPEIAFGEISVPVLHLTGTEDETPLGDFLPKDRLQPFQTIEGPPQYLLVLDGGDHMAFSGGEQGLRWYLRIPRHHDAIRHLSLAFWDAWLRDDGDAKAWLKEAKTHLEGTLKESDVWKVKAEMVELDPQRIEPGS